MIKEIKYLIFIISIFFFLFFSLRYYSSDVNKKNSFRLLNLSDKELSFNDTNLKILNSDTDEIIEYVDDELDNEKKDYKFWELLQKN